MHGNASLEIIASLFTPMLVGADPLEPRVIQDRLFHEHIKVGPEGAYAGALAAIDVALWDLRGKVLGPAQVKIRFDADKTTRDVDLAGDIAKARAVRTLVGEGFPLAFDSNNGYSVQGAIRVGRALEELGYVWFALSRGPRRRRQAQEAAGVLPHQLARGLLAERLPPRDHRVGVVREDRFRMRVVRREHQHVIAQQLDRGLRQRHTF